MGYKRIIKKKLQKIIKKFKNRISTILEWGDIMAVVYATLIIKGVKTIDDVPAVIRPKVIQVLKDLEVEVQ